MKFKKTNKLIYIAFAIHIMVTLLAGMEDEVLLLIMLIPLVGNLVGLYFLSFTDQLKLGAKIFMISSFFFVPIGMIGIIGCRKVTDHLTEQEFLKQK
jgi:hypothetical protein